MATSINWESSPSSETAIPWEQVEASLRIANRWPHPHKLNPWDAENPRRAAVAVLLRGGPAGAQEVVLVQRGHSAPQHGGELAFPGGMVEVWDRDLQATARRELAEELGVDQHLWELGCFPDVVPRARIRFTPVFLRWEEPAPHFQLSSEIQEVLRLPLNGLREAPWTLQRMELKGIHYELPRLELPLAPLWGATALVLKTWLDVLSTVRIP